MADLKPATKSVAFNFGPLLNESEPVPNQQGDDSDSLGNIYGVDSVMVPTDPASLDKVYRRHIARYYAKSATKYEDIDDSMFPDIPSMPIAAESPFLSDTRNKQVWEWLNRDFCKTKLDYFLSLCS